VWVFTGAGVEPEVGTMKKYRSCNRSAIFTFDRSRMIAFTELEIFVTGQMFD